MSTSPIIPTIMPPHKKDLHAGRALLRHLTGAFNDGGLDKMNTELHSLCGALSHSTPEHAVAIEGWLAKRAQESLEAAAAARASFT